MRVLIAGGGTAGHINPGLAIAKYIKQKRVDSVIHFVGTEKGLETDLVPREGFELKLIRVKGFRRRDFAQNIMAVRELFGGLKDALKLIKEFRPDIVIGTGGYVCGPVLLVASMLRIPTLIHEQNAFPGATNRILSFFVDKVAISFKEAGDLFKKKSKLVLTGNPLNPELLEVDRNISRKKFKIDNERPLVVVFGGSRGAEKINQTMVDLILNHYNENDFRLLYATGVNQYESVANEIGTNKLPGVELVPYIYNMHEAMGAADLIISRAGAMTVSEIAAMGIPSVLIPSPYVTANHQEHNAKTLERQGAGVIILEKNLTSEILYQQVKSLITDKDQLTKMGKNAKKVANISALEKIYSIIVDITIAKKR